MFLAKEELQELTGRTRRDAQVAALRSMGIEHRIRPDGSPAVLRAHVEQTLGAAGYTAKSTDVEPDWDDSG